MGRRVLWCLLLLCAVACQRQHGVPAKPVRKASNEEMIRRIDDIKKWGFIDAAEKLYRQLALSGNSEDARYAAFEQLHGLLRACGKETEMVAVQEQMVAGFPQRAAHLRSQLAAHYAAVWDWPKAKQMMQQCMTTAPDNERISLAEKISWIEAWEKRPLAWQENFLRRGLDWQIAHPDFYQLDNQQRQFMAHTLTGSWYHAGKGFYWDGGSSSVQWDVKVSSIDWLGSMEFGIFSPSDAPGLTVRMSCSGGTGDFHYGMTIQLANKAQDQRLRSTLPEYAPEVWYTMELAYLQNLRQACLRVWSRNNRLLLGEEVVKLAVPLAAGNYMIGFAPIRKGLTRDATSHAEVIIDNIELRGQNWKDCTNAWPLDHIYQIDAKALENPAQAYKECTELLQRQGEENPDWQLVETRAYLFVMIKENKKAAAELQRLLRLRPNHANKDYFQCLVSEYAKREN